MYTFLKPILKNSVFIVAILEKHPKSFIRAEDNSALERQQTTNYFWRTIFLPFCSDPMC